MVTFINLGAILTWWKGPNLWFPGIFWTMHFKNSMEFSILVYFDDLSDFDHCWSPNFASNLHWRNGSELGFPCIFWRTHKAWPAIWYTGVSWPPAELISFYSQSVGFLSFGAIFTRWNRSNLDFPGILWRRNEMIRLAFGMHIYRSPFPSWLHFGHGLLIFLFFAQFCLSDKDQI